MSDILEKILATKRAEIAAGLADVPLAEMQAARADGIRRHATSSARCARRSPPAGPR